MTKTNKSPPTLKTYSVTYSEDVSRYAYHDIEASNDEEAIAKAKEQGFSELYFDVGCSEPFHRSVYTIEDEEGETIIENVPLDEFFTGYGEEERRLFELAPKMLDALEAAHNFDWVANAAITDDMEALRKICLQYADWWNGLASPIIAKARGQ